MSPTTTSASKTAPSESPAPALACYQLRSLGRQYADGWTVARSPTALWPTAGDYDCTDLVHNRACWGGKVCNTNCYATESIDNNFIVLRSMAGSRFGNTLYAEFMTGNQMQEEIDFATHNLTFTEFYEMDSDPWMMQNKAEDATTPAAALSAALHVFYDCAGDTCP
jgi:hypothetical protein